MITQLGPRFREADRSASLRRRPRPRPSTTRPPRAMTSSTLPRVFFEEIILRCQYYDRHFSSITQSTVLHFPGGIALGGDVGDLLPLSLPPAQ